MQGSLCLHRGILYVARHEKTAHVEAYDLDGSRLEAGFSFRGEEVGRATAMGIAVDDDRHLWVADTVASQVRCFTLFGREIARLGTGPEEDRDPELVPDVAGAVRRPVDLAVEGDSDGSILTVVSGDRRRHAAQRFDGDGRLLASLRPEGDPRGRFQGLRGVARLGRRTYLAEAGAGRVQVFRDVDFHFLFRLPVAGDGRFEPTAVAPLPDGRAVVAQGGPASALLLIDPSGRLLRVLAGTGHGEGEVFEPNDVAVDPTGSDRTTRLAVIDRDGDRVQVFSLGGRCFGAFEDLAG